MNLLLLISLFIFIAFLTSLYRFGFGPYLLSLGTLFLMAFPITIRFKPSELENIDKYIYYGLYVMLPFFFYDIGVTFLNLPPLEQILGLFSSSKSTEVLGFYRVKSSFDEPSYLGIYLVVILYFFLNTKSYYRKKAFLIIFICIVFTLSLTAYILAFIVISLNNIRSIKRLILTYSAVAILLFSVPIVGDFLINRITTTVKSIANSNYSGSEGSRGNSILVLLKYLDEANSVQFFFGEGYGRYDTWLIKNFGMYNPAMVSFARGHINNAVAVIGISNGLIGLFFYLMIFVYLATSKLLTKKSLIIHFFVQFSYAFIVGYMFWGIILIFMLESRFNDKFLIPKTP
ncbi:MAG: hypothetical protein JJ971_07405 [Balneolaceae bacterium]|nr:hypothetical protein [Balneolaceae bacterium]MBO6546940.1 hypothetical protein [Balneolaceae bacterium]MBO6649300.1 hypothetical protein [Balneolaceae bacterium]